MTNEKITEKLNLIAEKVSGEIHEGYSGRGMNGVKCYGIDCDDYIFCIECAAVHGLNGASWDNLGLGFIVYWPRIPYEPDSKGTPQNPSEDARPQKLTKGHIASLPPEKRAELHSALEQATAGVSGLIGVLNILGLEERNAVHRLVLAMGELEHLEPADE